MSFVYHFCNKNLNELREYVEDSLLYRVVAPYNNIEKSLMICCVDEFGAQKRSRTSTSEGTWT